MVKLSGSGQIEVKKWSRGQEVVKGSKRGQGVKQWSRDQKVVKGLNSGQGFKWLSSGQEVVKYPEQKNRMSKAWPMHGSGMHELGPFSMHSSRHGECMGNAWPMSSSPMHG